MSVKFVFIAAFSLASFATTAQSALDSYILSQMSNKHLSGLSACVIKSGKVVWQGYYGLANRATMSPVTAGTGFMLASISKTVTATALMQLYEEGAFALEDDINDYLPFTVANPNFPDSVITFRQLLTHTSSIRDNWNVLNTIYTPGDSPVPLGQFLGQYLCDTGAYYNAGQNYYDYPPQTHYNYCNESAALCGYLTEVISGIPFNEYCNANIFQPLCLENTAWMLSELDTSLIAHPYSYSGGEYHDEGLYGYPDYPAGQLRTTSIALAKFLWMTMNHGSFDGIQILDTATVALMLTPQFPLIEPTQGLIWYSYTDDTGTWWGHGGGDAGVSTDMFFNDSSKTGIIVLTNGEGNHNNIWYAIADSSVTMETENAPDITCALTSAAAENFSSPACFIFPNPFHSSATLSINRQAGESDLFFYDLSGRVVKVLHHIQEGKTTIDRGELIAGVYLYRLLLHKEMVAYGKVVVY